MRGRRIGDRLAACRRQAATQELTDESDELFRRGEVSYFTRGQMLGSPVKLIARRNYGKLYDERAIGRELDLRSILHGEQKYRAAAPRGIHRSLNDRITWLDAAVL